MAIAKTKTVATSEVKDDTTNSHQDDTVKAPALDIKEIRGKSDVTAAEADTTDIKTVGIKTTDIKQNEAKPIATHNSQLVGSQLASSRNNSDATATYSDNVHHDHTTDSGAADIVVVNNHHDDLIETATGTRLPAHQTTHIKPTVYGTRERILSNLKQLNSLFNNKLTIKE